ncbi:uracil-DNA glycosylase [candidate division KSB1 bacterium]|nr:uracil-DNA glycosylase [candidate division KSB1 bacterium]
MKTVQLREQIALLQNELVQCRRCARLVKWREQVAREKVRRFAEEEYWGRPVPSFGDPNARLLIVGLAPAAHGGNRTGRIFTGDRSGDWLFRALHKAGFANQPSSQHREDGLRLKDCYITATCHCAPPENKPTREEMRNCRPFLLREMELLKRVRVIVALGKIGFEAAFTVFAEVYGKEYGAKPKFKHGVELQLVQGVMLLGSFHPSQQNTFTGRLTEAMFDGIFRRARQLISKS